MVRAHRLYTGTKKNGPKLNISKYQHEYNGNVIKETEISGGDIHQEVQSKPKTIWGVNKTLIKFSKSLTLSSFIYTVSCIYTPWKPTAVILHYASHGWNRQLQLEGYSKKNNPDWRAHSKKCVKTTCERPELGWHPPCRAGVCSWSTFWRASRPTPASVLQCGQMSASGPMTNEQSACRHPCRSPLWKFQVSGCPGNWKEHTPWARADALCAARVKIQSQHRSHSPAVRPASIPAHSLQNPEAKKAWNIHWKHSWANKYLPRAPFRTRKLLAIGMEKTKTALEVVSG